MSGIDEGGDLEPQMDTDEHGSRVRRMIVMKHTCLRVRISRVKLHETGLLFGWSF